MSVERKITIVILNWNGQKMMSRFLPSVMNYSDEAEIVVADNGSTDHSLEMLSQQFPSVRQIALGQNYGFAEGYNRAIAQVATPYVLLLNDDVEVTPHWLRPLLEFMEQHSDVAACQPKILSEHERDRFEYAGACGGFMDYLGYPYCRGRMFQTIEKDEGQYDEPCPVFWASGAALLVRTSVFEEEGGLDNRFFAHMEEIDFCWRLRSRGWGIYCIPQSVVYHVGGGTLQKSNPRKTFLNFRNNLLMLYKNLPEPMLKRVMMMRYWLDRLAALKMALSGNREEARAVMQGRADFKKLQKEYRKVRQENLEKTTQSILPEWQQKSLLVAYYLKGIKKFSDLK